MCLFVFQYHWFSFIALNWWHFLLKSLFSATTATSLEHLGTTITSDFDGTPPLYITKTRTNNQEYIYVNNALILHSRSNIQMVNEAGKKQVMYTIWTIYIHAYCSTVSKCVCKGFFYILSPVVSMFVEKCVCVRACALKSVFAAEYSSIIHHENWIAVLNNV